MTITNKLVSTLFLMAVSLSLIAGLNLNQAYSQNPSNSDPHILKGAITSTSNNGNTTDPAWILGGVYKFTEFNSSAPSFNASFYMAKTDGHCRTYSSYL